VLGPVSLVVVIDCPLKACRCSRSPRVPLSRSGPTRETPPPQAPESVSPEGGGVADPIRNRICGAISGDGVASHALYKLRAKLPRKGTI
jgi:hypothetical protein